MDNPKKGIPDFLSPGATLAALLCVLAGLAGVLMTLTGSHQTWLGPVPWVLVAVGSLLLFLTGTVIARPTGWRGAHGSVNVALALVGFGLLVATAILAFSKADQAVHAQLRDKIAEMAALAASAQQQAKQGLKPNPVTTKRLVELEGEIGQLREKATAFSTKADLDKTIAEAIEKHEKDKPKHVEPAPGALVARLPEPPTKPDAPAGEPDGDGEEPTSPNPGKKPEPDKPADPTPPGTSSPEDEGGKEQFLTALTAALVAAGIPLGYILAILAVLGGLFNGGVTEKDVGPIAAAVQTIHANGGAITPDEIQKILKGAENPEAVAQALRELSKQPYFRERLTPDARKALEQASKPKESKPSTPTDDGGAETPKAPPKKGKTKVG